MAKKSRAKTTVAQEDSSSALEQHMFFLEMTYCPVSRTIVYWPETPRGHTDMINAGNSLELFLKFYQLSMDSDEEIHIILNTVGGDLENSLALYDLISTSRCYVTVTCIGAVMSGGAIILQAADQRLLYPHTAFMMHNLSASLPGAKLHDIVASTNYLLAQQKQINQIFTTRNTMRYGYEFFEDKFKHDWFLTSQDAIQYGLADGIITPQPTMELKEE